MPIKAKKTGGLAAGGAIEAAAKKRLTKKGATPSTGTGATLPVTTAPAAGVISKNRAARVKKGTTPVASVDPTKVPGGPTTPMAGDPVMTPADANMTDIHGNAVVGETSAPSIPNSIPPPTSAPEKEEEPTDTSNLVASAEGDEHDHPAAPEEAGATADPSTTPDTGATDAVIKGLPAEQQAQAEALMAPWDKYIKEQQAVLQDGKTETIAAITQIGENMKTMLQNTQSDLRAQQARWDAVNKQIEERKLQEAKNTYERNRNLAAASKEAEQMEMQRAIRDAEMQQSKDRKDLLLGLGISGGWRASSKVGNVYFALKKGEDTIMDMRVDKVYAGRVWDEKLMDIENTYHANQVAAHDAYMTESNILFDKLIEAAEKTDGTILDTGKEMITAQKDLMEKTADALGELAKARAEAAEENTKWVVEQARLARGEQRDRISDLNQDVEFGITQGLHTNKNWLASINRRRSDLGLDPLPDDLMTINQMKEEEKAIADNAAFALIGKYRDSKDGTDYGLILSNAVRGQGDDKRRRSAIAQGEALLAQGRIDEFKDSVLINAYESLGEGKKGQFDMLEDTITETGFVQGQLATLDKKFGGVWKAAKESAKPVSNVTRDKEFLSLIGDIQAYQAQLIHQLYGANLTEGELERANTFLIDTKVDNAEEMLVKINSLRGFSTRALERRYDKILGKGNYKKMSGLGFGDQSTKFDVEDDNDFENDFDSIFNEQMGDYGGPDEYANEYSAITQRFDTPVNYMKSGTHGGIDYDGKIGDPVPAFRGGAVVDIVDQGKKGYGLYVDVMDEQGYVHRYGHLNKTHVKKGDKISPRQRIADVGNSGHVLSGSGGDGSHVHYEVRKDGKLIDPEKEFTKKTFAKK